MVVVVGAWVGFGADRVVEVGLGRAVVAVGAAVTRVGGSAVAPPLGIRAEGGDEDAVVGSGGRIVSGG